MRIHRLYQNQPLIAGSTIALSSAASHYLIDVLRLAAQTPLVVFNGDGFDYPATLIHADHKKALVLLDDQKINATESPLTIHLAQGIAKGDKMDLIIQKSVELGVTSITPLFTERCDVKLNADRLQKKVEHWQAVAQSACEQSGRAKLVVINPPQHLRNWIGEEQSGLCITADPFTTTTLNDVTPPPKSITTLIGPEGGLSPEEITMTVRHQFLPIRLGSRILRTETAPLAFLTAFQVLWGDFGK